MKTVQLKPQDSSNRIEKFRKMVQLIGDDNATGLANLMANSHYYCVLELKSFWYVLQCHPMVVSQLKYKVKYNDRVPFTARKTIEHLAAFKTNYAIVYTVDALQDNPDAVLEATLFRYLGEDLKGLLI